MTDLKHKINHKLLMSLMVQQQKDQNDLVKYFINNSVINEPEDIHSLVTFAQNIYNNKTKYLYTNSFYILANFLEVHIQDLIFIEPKKEKVIINSEVFYSYNIEFMEQMRLKICFNHFVNKFNKIKGNYGVEESWMYNLYYGKQKKIMGSTLITLGKVFGVCPLNFIKGIQINE